METNIPLTPDQIPPSFARCFQSDCPKAEGCAHFLAGKYISEGCVSGPAVYHTARKGATCKCYKQTRIMHVTYGFTALFAEVKRKDDANLRRNIKAYLGGTPPTTASTTANVSSPPNSRSGSSTSSADTDIRMNALRRVSRCL